MILYYKRLSSDKDFRIDMTPVIPQKCLSANNDAAQMALKTTSGVYRLGTLFDVAVDEPNKLIVRNSCEQLDYLGAKMNGGDMVVDGNSGDYCAERMSGGRLHLNGNTGNYLASMMRGGRLDLYGNAGDYVSAPRAGVMQGQQGGTVVIHGNAGKRLGDRMRRGMLIVTGDADAYCACRMIAGSIVVRGGIGAHFGIGMRRGSLIVSEKVDFSTVDYFSKPRFQEVIFMILMLQYLRTLDSALESILPISRMQRCVGDLSVGGLGEVLVIPG